MVTNFQVQVFESLTIAGNQTYSLSLLGSESYHVVLNRVKNV